MRFITFDFSILGYIHNGIHVLWFVKTIPEKNEEERQAITTASMEALVYTDTFCPQVSASFSKRCLIMNGGNSFNRT